MKKYFKIIVVMILVATIVGTIVIINSSNKIASVQKVTMADTTNNGIDSARGTIINVPVDSRPVNTSNFSYLVNAAGYNYKEITDGMDSMGADGETYNQGDSAKIRTATATAVANSNTNNTTVIINTASYFCGGLTGARDYAQYDITKKDSKINELKTLITTNTNPTYYVVLTLPATVIEDKCISVPTENVSGLDAYYHRDVVKDITTLTTTTPFKDAATTWAYFKYYQQVKSMETGDDVTTIFKTLPQYVQNFCNEFYDKYNTQQTTKYLDNYVAMYSNSYAYLMGLAQLKAQGVNFKLVVNIDNLALSPFITSHISDAGKTNFEYIEKDSNGNVKKYSGPYYLMKLIESKEQTDVRNNYDYFIPGTDETNYLLLAKDVAAKANKQMQFICYSADTGVKEDYKNASIDKAVGSTINMDVADARLSLDGIIKNAWQVIYNTSTDSINVLADLTAEDTDLTIQNITTEQDMDKLTISTVNLPETLLKKINDANYVFKDAYCGSNKSVEHSVGIGLANATVYSILKAECSQNITDTTYVKSRVTNFVQNQIINVLDGDIYNSHKGTISESSTDLANRICYVNGTVGSASDNVLTKIKNNVYTIGNYQYKVNDVTITATRPWNRINEVKVTPTLSNFNFTVADTLAPDFTVTPDITTTTPDPVTLTINATDSGVGLAEQPYSFDGGKTWQSSNKKAYTENTSGIVVKVKDAAGNISAGKTVDITNISTTPTENTKTTAKYTVRHFVENANDSSYVLETTITKDGTVGENVTPEVKTFVGFNSPSAQTVQVKADGSTVVDYKYTRKTHTIKITKGEGISDVQGEGTYKYEQTVTLTATLADGYKNVIWSGDSNTGVFNMPDKDITITVSATKDSQTPTTGYSYTVSYNANAPTNTTATGTMTDLNCNSGTAYTLAKNNYVVPGYTFKWWNTKADGTGTIYTDGANIQDLTTTKGSTVTLYAQWKQSTDTSLEVQTQYSTTELTNKDVTVTIYGSNELTATDGWTLSADKKSMSKVYTENKKETVIVTDTLGNKKSVDINVANIDKTKPQTTISYTKNSDNTITATITSNEKVKPVDGWTSSNDGLKLTKTYNKSTSDDVVISDLAGNTTNQKVVIDLTTKTDTTTQTETNKNNSSTSSSSSSSSDKTTATSSIPQTGDKKVIIPIVITIIGIVSYVIYRRYRKM